MKSAKVARGSQLMNAAKVLQRADRISLFDMRLKRWLCDWLAMRREFGGGRSAPYQVIHVGDGQARGKGGCEKVLRVN